MLWEGLEEEDCEKESRVQKKEVCVCAESDTAATFLLLLTEILFTSITSHEQTYRYDMKQTSCAGSVSVDNVTK